MMSEQVDCPEHGMGEGCMICRHLVAGANLGFARVPADPEGHGYETVMCEACEALLLSEQEWSEAHARHAGWTLYCRQCCEKVLRSHTLVAEGRAR